MRWPSGMQRKRRLRARRKTHEKWRNRASRVRTAPRKIRRVRSLSQQRPGGRRQGVARGHCDHRGSEHHCRAHQGGTRDRRVQPFRNSRASSHRWNRAPTLSARGNDGCSAAAASSYDLSARRAPGTRGIVSAEQRPARGGEASEAEVILPAVPGRFFKARVESVGAVIPEGQLQPSGTLISAESIKSEGRVTVRVKFEEDVSQFRIVPGIRATWRSTATTCITSGLCARSSSA